MTRIPQREDVIQASIMEYLRLALPRTHVPFAIPNGGLRSKREAAKLKWTGTLAGIPDLCIIGPGGQSYWLEVKTPIGRLSEAQRAVHDHFRANDVPVALVRSIADVEITLRLWGLMHARAA